MALKFQCSHCNKSIIVRYLKIGEDAQCAICGVRTTVPADANHIDATDYISPMASKSCSETIQVVETPKSSLTTEIFRALGIVFNSFVFTYFAFVLVNPTFFDAELIIQALAFLTSVSTIYALAIRSNRYIKVAFVANIIVPLLLGILISIYGRYYSIFIGMFMIMQGLASIISLAVTYKRSSPSEIPLFTISPRPSIFCILLKK